MTDATLKMVLLGQDRGASRAIKNVGDAAAKTETRSHRLAAGFAKVGKVAAVGLGAGLVAGALAAKKFATAAIEDQQSAALMAKQFRNSAGATRGQIKATEDWITKQGIAKGVADDQLRPALSKLITSTHDVGKAQKLASLAMDVSAGTGKDLQAVSTALMKAQNGNVSGLARLGIATKDAHGKTLSFTEATKKMADQFGGAATTKANTLQGKMDRLKLVMSEAGEAIGYKLIPFITKGAEWILKLVKSMQSGGDAAGVFGAVMGAIGDVIKVIAHWVGNELIPAWKDLAKRFVDAMGGAKGFKQALKDMKPAAEFLGRVLKVLWEGLKAAAKVIIPGVAVAFRLLAKVIGTLGKAATWLWNNAFQPTIKFILKGIGWLMDKIADLLGALGHVPGFGWAKDAADKMHHAAKKANEMADAIRDIPPNKKVKITVTTVRKNRGASGNVGKGSAPDAIAVGTRFASGGTAWVGERGPEFVELPRGSRVHTAQDSARMGGSGGASTPVVINVNGALDANAVAKQIEQLLDRLQHSKGRPLAFMATR